MKKLNTREQEIVADVIESYKSNIGFAYDVHKAVIPDLVVFSEGPYVLVKCCFKEINTLDFKYQASSEPGDSDLFKEPYEIKSEEIRNMLLLDKM